MNGEFEAGQQANETGPRSQQAVSFWVSWYEISPTCGPLYYVILTERIQRRIYLIRDQKIMLDSDLAGLYGVQTKALNQAVKRHQKRFPKDFAFQLTRKEAEGLRSQFVTSNGSRGGRRYLPFAFTEHGIAMLSSVLNSERAVQMNIVVVRAFIKLRDLMVSEASLAAKVGDLTSNQEKHTAILRKHGAVIGVLASEIRELKQLPAVEKAKRRIGFSSAEETNRTQARERKQSSMVATAKSA
jgi:hypothetical protein